MISVVMGVSSLDKYIDLAIDSILKQTYPDFEFLIIANGVNSEAIANYIERTFDDNRIVVLRSKIPQLAHALNIGLDHAQYDYVARMDADDIAEPERLKKQLDFLLKNNLDLVGSAVTLIDETGKVIGARDVKHGKDINFWLDFKSCFVHPSVFYKKNAVINARGYNAGFNSEDYDLWLRMRRVGVRWENMSERLLKYRIHSAASQRRLLGYAEVAGYSLREFLLKKRLNGLLAVLIQSAKTIFLPRN